MTAITPMLASVGDGLPPGEGWVFEPKYDGVRVLAFVERGDIALISRNGIDKAQSFPEIVEALAALRGRVRRPFVVDGEIVVLRDDAPSRFQDLQSRMHVSDRSAVASLRRDSPVALMVFDLLLEGKQPLVHEPWHERRAQLRELLSKVDAKHRATLRLSDVATDGAALLDEAREHAWEGVIAKRADAPYEPGRRSRSWLKLKLEQRQEFVVGGWTEPRRAREYFGAILLGYYDGDRLVYAGHTGTGFTRRSLAELFARLRPLEQRTSPFSTTPKTNEPAHWTRPDIVVEIKFNEWTSAGILRQPVFIGVRDDKRPTDVVREPQSKLNGKHSTRRSQKAKAMRYEPNDDAGRRTAGSRTRAGKTTRSGRKQSKSDDVRIVGTSRATTQAKKAVAQLDAIIAGDGSGVLTLPTGELEVSNLHKVFFPKSKATKGDLMRFYAEISPALLPTMRDRPLVMKRFPNGVKGKSFYQQKAPADAPDSVRVESVSDEGMTTADRLVGGDLATLLYLVQLGAISVDPWHSRVQSIQSADYAIIDLDPGPRARFSHVVEVAHVVKETLDELGLHGVPKTSGASGMHVALPLPSGVPNEGARMLAELVATRVADRIPKIATIERWVKSRPAGAIYVDFLQNIRGKTVAGVYSVRAQSTATVSTPLDWKEITEDLDPTAFTIETVPDRLRKRGDLWAKGMKTPNELEQLIAGARRRG
jgi:bifunctional non-homologous end joining protein LigD